MKNVVEQLSTYKSVHLNKNNIKTHFIGVPMIIWAIMVLLSLVTIPLPIEMAYPVSLAMVLFVGVIIYYFLLNVSLAIGQVIFFVPLLYSANIVAQMPYAAWIAIGVFVVGWIFQFVGHYFERAKPAFVDDMNQLLIGPLFIMAEFLFAVGALAKLNQEITKIAIDKRRIFESNRTDSATSTSNPKEA